MVHYENNIHLQNKEHNKMQLVPVSFNLKLHIKQAGFLFFHLKWFNMHSGWPGHGSTRLPQRLKPWKNEDLVLGETFSLAWVLIRWA